MIRSWEHSRMRLCQGARQPTIQPQETWEHCKNGSGQLQCLQWWWWQQQGHISREVGTKHTKQLFIVPAHMHPLCRHLALGKSPSPGTDLETFSECLPRSVHETIAIWSGHFLCKWSLGVLGYPASLPVFPRNQRTEIACHSSPLPMWPRRQQGG